MFLYGCGLFSQFVRPAFGNRSIDATETQQQRRQQQQQIVPPARNLHSHSGGGATSTTNGEPHELFVYPVSVVCTSIGVMYY
jgi:hypothetical protein